MNNVGTLDTFSLTGTRHKIVIKPADVERYASEGLTKREIAKKVGMCYTTFRGHLVNSTAVLRAWERGARRAGTFSDKQIPKSIQDDDGDTTICLRPGDQTITLRAIAKKSHKGSKLPQRKRIGMLRELTDLDTGTIIQSIERLVIHQLVTVHVGIIFTEYEAVLETEK